jgi:hypothetical protein
MRIQHTAACEQNTMGRAVALFRESIADGYNYDLTGLRPDGHAESARDLNPVHLFAHLDQIVEKMHRFDSCDCAKLALGRCQTELTRLRQAQRHAFSADRLGPIADYTAVRDELRAYIAGTR